MTQTKKVANKQNLDFLHIQKFYNPHLTLGKYINFVDLSLLHRYRPAPETDENVVTSPKKTKSETKASKSSHKKKSEDLWTGNRAMFNTHFVISFLFGSCDGICS